MSNSNSNWEEKPDGWHKKPGSTTKGNANYFTRPIPPVRDGATGHPIGKGGKINWKQVIRESNEKHGS